MNAQFKKGVLELIVLAAVEQKDMYGYELVAEDVSYTHLDVYKRQVLECTDNAYFSKLLYTASECYIRFAVSCGANEKESKCREEMKQIILEENGANLDSISGRKKIFKKIDAWMKALADNVNAERGKNK